MLDITKIKKELPYLQEYSKNLFKQTEDLKDLSVFYDITEPMQTFTWIQASEKMA